jgi:hypothetical protein
MTEQAREILLLHKEVVITSNHPKNMLEQLRTSLELPEQVSLPIHMWCTVYSTLKSSLTEHGCLLAFSYELLSADMRTSMFWRLILLHLNHHEKS